MYKAQRNILASIAVPLVLRIVRAIFLEAYIYGFLLRSPKICRIVT